MDDLTGFRRAWFEKAMTSEGYSELEWMGNHYRCDDIDDMWRGFKLAIDSVVVELPKPHSTNGGDCVIDLEECREAIHAAGARTK